MFNVSILYVCTLYSFMWIRTYRHIHMHKKHIYMWTIHTPIKWAWEWRSKTWFHCNTHTHYYISLLFWSPFFTLFNTIIYFFFKARQKKIWTEKIQLYHKNYRQIYYQNGKWKCEKKHNDWIWSGTIARAITNQQSNNIIQWVEENNTHQSNKIDYILLWNFLYTHTHTRTHIHIFVNINISEEKGMAKEMEKNKIVYYFQIYCAAAVWDIPNLLRSFSMYCIYCFFFSYSIFISHLIFFSLLL